MERNHSSNKFNKGQRHGKKIMSQLMYHGQEGRWGRVHVKYTTMQRLIMTMLPDHLKQNCTFTLLLVMWFLTVLVA
jgi:hypothetical protein